MINNKFHKIICVVVIAIIILVSLTYFTRTVIDIGCAKTAKPKGAFDWKRNFLTIDCNYWEKILKVQFLDERRISDY